MSHFFHVLATLYRFKYEGHFTSCLRYLIRWRIVPNFGVLLPEEISMRKITRAHEQDANKRDARRAQGQQCHGLVWRTLVLPR
jgi:hypothetical protein